MSKIITMAAAATGYVFGARAGRGRYEQISGQAQRLWQDPRVQRMAEKTPVVKDRVTGAASSSAAAYPADYTADAYPADAGFDSPADPVTYPADSGLGDPPPASSRLP